jgi:hypothetical protein
LLELADACARLVDLHLEMAGVRLHLPGLHLHGHERALRQQQILRELLAVALRLVAHDAVFLELRVDDLDPALQLRARLRVPALDAGAEELRQRQGRDSTSCSSRYQLRNSSAGKGGPGCAGATGPRYSAR